MTMTPLIRRRRAFGAKEMTVDGDVAYSRGEGRIVQPSQPSQPPQHHRRHPDPVDTIVLQQQAFNALDSIVVNFSTNPFLYEMLGFIRDQIRFRYGTFSPASPAPNYQFSSMQEMAATQGVWKQILQTSLSYAKQIGPDTVASILQMIIDKRFARAERLRNRYDL